MPDFYAMIRQESKYYGQDDGKPFAISLAHSSDGYIWEGDPGRYRICDLILLVPSSPSLKEAESTISWSDEEFVTAGSIEAEEIYQNNLMECHWFRPISNQNAEPWFQYVNRDGKIHH